VYLYLPEQPTRPILLVRDAGHPNYGNTNPGSG
jgi:hypothetical protein